MPPEDNYLTMGNYGLLGYGASAPAFNNQSLLGADFSTQAIRDAGTYTSLNPTAGMGGIGSGTDTGFNWGSLFGGTNADGTKNPNYAGMALGAIQGLGSAYMGMKQYGLAKDQLKFSKEAFNRNYAAQRTSTNNMINDRNVARTASRQGASSSPYKPLELVA